MTDEARHREAASWSGDETPQLYRARCAQLAPTLVPLATQERAAELLARHRRLIVRLPTGTGKTLLAALPFAAGLLEPRQMIFMTPLRTLASAQAEALRDEIDAAAATDLLGRPWEVRVQTGAAPEDPLFTAPAVVCTFDQALSSALSIAYSTSRGRRAINAGAILSSYLVADELHLFPRDEALTTLLWLLTNRPPELPFTLMTATLSRPVTVALAELLGAVVLDTLPATDAERLTIEDRQRLVRWQETPFEAAGIVEAARASHDGRAIVVVNTVRRSQELGAELAAVLGWERVTVLHSRYYPTDRKGIEEQIHERFGKPAEGEHDTQTPMVLVATQVIEVGLDISAGVLFTEWAPANALVQRWGRAARWGGIAEIVVAPPPDLPASGLPIPYERSLAERDPLERTRTWLTREAGVGLDMTPEIEQAFVDEVHGPSDEAWVRDLGSKLQQQAVDMGKAIQDGLYSHAGGLIRRVDNRTVLLHGEPEALTDPWAMSGFSLASGTLYGVLRPREAGAPAEGMVDEEEDLVSLDLPVDSWRLKVPIWTAELAESQGEARSNQPLGWREAGYEDVKKEPLFALSPTRGSYDARLGLRLVPSDDPSDRTVWSAAVAKESVSGRRALYQRETFRQHSERMRRVLDENLALWPAVAPLAPRIEAWCGWPPGLLRRLTLAAITLHDAGKLTAGWQKGARQYQKMVGEPIWRWLVHTDQQKGVRLNVPAHALAGAGYALGLGTHFDQEVLAWRQGQDQANGDVAKALDPSEGLKGRLPVGVVQCCRRRKGSRPV